jgi:uncharacterized membrane protein YhhN
MKNKILTAAYAVTGIVYLISENNSFGIPQEVLKALIIPILIAVLLVNFRLSENKMHVLMLAGLIFSWAGDIILEIPGGNPLIFIAGLVSFLMAHVMYFTVFFITPGKNLIKGRNFILLIPLVIIGISLVGFLNKDLGEMRFPVVMYTTVILTMVAGALNRRLKVTRSSFWLVLTGAFLFLFSDSVIAIAKFGHPFPESGLVVMATYITAQYLIVTGYIRQFRPGQ